MSLKNLLALQAQKKAAAEPASAPKSDSVASPPSEPAAESAEAESPKPAPSAAPKGLGLNLAGAAKATQALKAAKPAPAPTPPKELDSDSFSLEDLAGMDASTIETQDSGTISGFEDEILATAPDRELPADLTQQQLDFIESLDSIYSILHDPEMFGQTVRMVMIELQDNPEYDKLLSDSDVHVMIRGMRRTMGLSRVRKQEKSRKAGTNKNAQKKAGVSDDAMALLNSLMGSE